MQWGRWLAMSDQIGYKYNDENQLANLSLRFARLPVLPAGPPRAILAYALKGDIGRHLPPASKHLARLFAFATYAVHMATGKDFPLQTGEGGPMAQIQFIANHFPPIESTAGPVFEPAQPSTAPVFFRLDGGVLGAAATDAPPAGTGTVATGPLPVDAAGGAGTAATGAPPAGTVATGPLPVDAAGGAGTALVHPQRQRFLYTAADAPLTEAACDSINSSLAVSNALLSRQVRLYDSLLLSLSQSGPAVRAAITNIWLARPASDREILVAVTSLVNGISSNVVATATGALPQTDPAHSPAQFADSPGLPVMPLAVLPASLSPLDAYRLVSHTVLY
jgi:hypothetical protein